jgi:hypothetical protein
MSSINEKGAMEETTKSDVDSDKVKNIDQAALFLAEAEGFEPFTAKQEQRLKRKIDFILIPMVSGFPT